ncbi:MAG: hypothetical protein IPK16_24900 [Anaerolineales bacterium]|nr:hypothetical protein [Anaerolineales bacterium]
MLSHSAAALALVYTAQGQPEKASETAELMVSFALEIRGTGGIFTARAFQAELALRQGRLAEASYWAEHTDIPLLLPLPFFYRPPLTLARVLLAQNTTHSRQQAAHVLSTLHHYAKSTHCSAVMIEVLAIQALHYEAEGSEQAGLEALQQALTLAEPGGFIRTFVDLGAPLQRLLAVFVSKRSPSPYAAKILAAFPQTLPQQRSESGPIRPCLTAHAANLRS